ncbi:3-oxoacid CoA-transferase subunit B [Mesorhizobium mediterraneum]|uniref:Acyl CoA:acetate/3-ketoacid CoA transferase subunit beta n=2 Tax=Phyllobacteriaceae TaxID=69277 RepID=A0AB36R0K8_9HYPH|nr:3-oxoacid CoA-transferase subunit B [Mesorhizobium mediterraneum]PAP97921.1 acyl CoA:acetate/3-ketoacid CoA transferase subunit beta [Mesorhizobium mediterraneum]RWD74545.1 MAG: 3-oxoacid CoA-transferase subunit B [Mesorhizobium sp.]RWN28912.1 MAG: 3-oxoacid CoA-transferase subunit B [Mesorhizobium sp.]WIW55510.1 3-oxoacid CoA-transferase subunit B [Mesorhizobium mediterraneum]
MLKRAAADILSGMTVNLGIGLPTEVLQYVSPSTAVCLHSENGIAGVGQVSAPEKADRNLIDAGGAYVSIIPGTAFFDSAVSFAIVRSGRLDLSLLGAFQVASNGDLANWKIPGKFSPGMGGAIELAQKARRVGVIMMHTDSKGNPKILSQCSLPLTAKGHVNRIYTDMAVFDITAEGLCLREIADGTSLAELEALTSATFRVPNQDLPRF